MTVTSEVIDAHAEVVVEDTTKLERPEWLALRRLGIGGSDAAAALSLSPYDSRYALWVDKTMGVDDEDNESMFWGRQLEEAIGRGYAIKTGKVVERFPKLLRSRRWPHMQVNLDFINPAELEVVEVKNTGAHMGDLWQDDDGRPVVPPHYAIQGLHELAVTGFERTTFPVLVGGNRMKMVTIERDDKVIEDLAEAEAAFWKLVEENTPPAVDGSRATSETLAAIYGDPDPDSIIALDDYRTSDGESVPDLVKGYKDAAARVKAAKDDQDYYKNNLLAAMGDFEVAIIGGHPVVTFKKVDNGGYTSVVQPFSYRRINTKPKGAQK